MHEMQTCNVRCLSGKPYINVLEMTYFSQKSEEIYHLDFEDYSARKSIFFNKMQVH